MTRASYLFALLLVACGDQPAPTAIDAGPDAMVSVPDATVGSDATVGPLALVGHVAVREEDASEMSIGLTLAGDHAYIGYRQAGEVRIVDISDPTSPQVVGSFLADSDVTELHAIADLDVLYLLRGPLGLVAYDISDRTHPVELDAYEFTTQTLAHEMFVWRDPADPVRVLLFVADVDGDLGGLHVLDVSNPAAITLLWRSATPAAHSVSVSADGTRADLAQVQAGLAVMDVSQLTSNAPDPAGVLLTEASQFLVDCSPTAPRCITHSAVRIPGQEVAVVTYENEGCPEGFMNLVDVSDPADLAVVGTFKHERYMDCPATGFDPDLGLFGYGPHNPTLTPHLALVSWYRAGLLVFDVTDPTAPVVVDSFSPDVAPGSVLGWGRVAFVSYPIVQDGLIHVLDGRNGLYILRYTGPYSGDLAGAGLLEGNSNL